jgi:hypothetical protein
MDTVQPSRWRLVASTSLLTLGCLLLLASLALPWMHLANPLGRGAGAEGWYSPGVAVIDLLVVGQAPMPAASLAFVAIAAIIVGRSGWRLWSPERADASGTRIIVIALALVELGIVGITELMMPFALAFGYPYYRVTVLGGGYVAAMGLLCAVAGAALLETTTSPSDPLPEGEGEPRPEDALVASDPVSIS